MIVKIEDLRVGDEILMAAGSRINYFIVLKAPALSKYGTLRSVKVSQAFGEVTTTKGAYTWKHKRGICSPDEHNKVKYVNLSYKDIWLVNRKNVMI